jgi:hypothetical protein
MRADCFPSRAQVERTRLTLGSIIKERRRKLSAIVELSVAEVVANFYKKFGQTVCRLALGMLQALNSAELG